MKMPLPTYYTRVRVREAQNKPARLSPKTARPVL
jgi:hypothetical protein